MKKIIWMIVGDELLDGRCATAVMAGNNHVTDNNMLLILNKRHISLDDGRIAVDAGDPSGAVVVAELEVRQPDVHYAFQQLQGVRR
ncbi:MAG TPA: hypothetical protein VH682_18415 [Gemmataceae bacterium]